jgi:hypothetical protein
VVLGLNFGLSLAKQVFYHLRMCILSLGVVFYKCQLGPVVDGSDAVSNQKILKFFVSHMEGSRQGRTRGYNGVY